MVKILKPSAGPENPAWAQRIDAALKAGEKPEYSDLEEGVTQLLNENAMLKEYIKQSQGLLTRMVMARHLKNNALVLSELDKFIKQYVKLKPIAPAKKPH